MSPPPASGFAAAWLARQPRATAFLPSPDEGEARLVAVRSAAARRVPEALLEVLRAQQRALPADPSRDRSLELLGRGGAAVVVTGQQTGLFGGPLYSVYKALSAVAAARALERESGVPVVPLFWLQTEDHDFPEIAECVLPRPGEPEPLRVAISDGGVGARISVAERRLGADVEARLAEVEAVLSPLPHGAEVTRLLRECYVPGRPLAAAFAQLMARVLHGRGLLFLDPRPPHSPTAGAEGAGGARLSSLLAPLYRRAIEEAGPIAALLGDRAAALGAAGFDVQVHVRPGSPLCFVHVPDEAGSRHRLDPEGAGGFRLVGDVAGGVITRAELVDLAVRVPRRFSTSALLRPVAQDLLLPTAAYVGGPGEIAYFAQLGGLHDHFRELLGRPLPLLLHRARFRCIPARTGALLDEMHMTASEAARPRDVVLAHLAERHADPTLPTPSALRESLAAAARAALDPAAARADALHPELVRAAARTRATVERAFDRYASRYARVLRERDLVTAARVDRLQAVLAPGGEPQERVFGLPWFAAHVGVERFAALLEDALGSPYDASLREVAL